MLFGTRTPDGIRILGSTPMPCEHATGPSFVLSHRDETRLADLLGDLASDANLVGMEPVGWYHSHTRSQIFLGQSDVQLYDRHFPQPDRVALVLRPQTGGPPRAGFFFRERDGKLRTDASYSEFYIGAGGQPENISTEEPTSATPASARPETVQAGDAQKAIGQSVRFDREDVSGYYVPARAQAPDEPEPGDPVRDPNPEPVKPIEDPYPEPGEPPRQDPDPTPDKPRVRAETLWPNSFPDRGPAALDEPASWSRTEQATTGAVQHEPESYELAQSESAMDRGWRDGSDVDVRAPSGYRMEPRPDPRWAYYEHEEPRPRRSWLWAVALLAGMAIGGAGARALWPIRVPGPERVVEITRPAAVEARPAPERETDSAELRKIGSQRAELERENRKLKAEVEKLTSRNRDLERGIQRMRNLLQHEMRRRRR